MLADTAEIHQIAVDMMNLRQIIKTDFDAIKSLARSVRHAEPRHAALCWGVLCCSGVLWWCRVVCRVVWCGRRVAGNPRDCVGLTVLTPHAAPLRANVFTHPPRTIKNLTFEPNPPSWVW